MHSLGKRSRLFILCVLLSHSVCADDTDVYLNPVVPSGAEPLVMFSLDYRPNLGSTACNGTVMDINDLDGDGNTSESINECAQLIAEGYLPSSGPYSFFDVLRAVFKKVLTPLKGVKVGFMINHEHSTNCAGPQASKKCSNGGYILHGFRSLYADDSNGAKVLLHNRLSAIPTPAGNVSHSYQGKELFLEFFRYLTGQGVYNAHNGWVDYNTNNSQNLPDEQPLYSWDASIENGGDYISPLASATACTKIFTINLLFQVSNQDDDSNSAISDSKANEGMALSLQGNDKKFDKVIRYLHDVDLADGTFGTVPNVDQAQVNVKSFFFVDSNHINQTTESYAVAGGTGNPIALSSNPNELVTQLEATFQKILSVSTTFVAPSVPVNVYNRAETVNEVFMALFQPDGDGFPQWVGNLKKLQIGENSITGRRELQDVNGINAIDIDGRIKREALTFWTDAGALPSPSSDEVAGKDGRSVARGGTGQKMPGFMSGSPGQLNSDGGARQIFTEDPTDMTDGLMPLNADTTTAAALWSVLTTKWSPSATSASYSAATQAEKDKAMNILRFARGLQDDGTTTRTWLLADPLHSRPKPINYGARATGYDADNPDIRILMGTNDGLLHMFRNTDTSDAQDGTEIWAFMPREVMPALDRLRGNAPGTPVHPITVDGAPVVYTKDTNGDGALKSGDNDLVYAYFGLRRGGKTHYALDISDPDSPKFLWKITKGAAGSDFAEFGQSWSTPQLGHVKVGTDVLPVLIFGAGYNGDDEGDNVPDLGKDAANRVSPQAVGTDDDEGNAVYVVNALNGNLIWKATYGATEGYNSSAKAYLHPNMLDSIPSEIATADTNGNGLLDRIYAGDTGGIVWRIDLVGKIDTDSDGIPDTLVNNDPSIWTVNKLLSVGRHSSGGATVARDRRFFNRPDVVQSRDATGPFDGVLIGSGDRENPNGTDVDNWFYVVKDRAIVSGEPSGTTFEEGDLADLSDNCLQDNSCGSTPNLGNGWRIALSDNGEKNLGAAVTAGGTVFFTTFAPTPPAGVCSLSEGKGYLYAISFQDATAVFNFSIVNDTAQGVVLDRRIKLSSGGIPVEPVPLGRGEILVQGMDGGRNIMRTGGRTSFKTYWYEAYE